MARHRFFYLLNLARHRVYKLSERHAQQRLGISAAQLGMLFVVARHPGLRQRQLADQLGYNESAVTALLRRMSEAELVVRRPDPSDRRASCIHPSARGTRLVKQAMPLLAQLNHRLMDGFSEQELDVVARFLAAAIDRFAEDEYEDQTPKK